ncbi:ssDNA endodeoxyribonuclease RAD2 [Sporobolomyces salmoneus]|uniref:ssDNA endodeoxyribonuclease RAD2 n=1 Tax=Sporobolomyces salmoneus TaxID=183962 RepID=UPI0031772160
MGVHGLWSLLSPVARPITPESLKDKRLAVDASIWLYQFQMAIRDRKTGEALKGNHIQGTYRRILKLLHWGIKPVFVFDGDAPLLKKRTIEKRKRRKEGAGRDLAKTAQQLLSAQLRNHAAENALARRRNAEANANEQMDTGEEIGNDAVYLEDLEAGRGPITVAAPPTTPAHIKKARKDAMRDEYALPAIDGGVESRVKMSDPRVATAEEFRDFIEDLRPEDLDINSDFFGNLPTEVKYEILGELRIKTRQVNHKRNQEMRGATTAIDFSRAQIDNLMQRNHYTQKLLAVTDELGTAAIAIPTRVAGTRNREYLLVKQDASKGGGWVLGVKNPELGSTEPITIETTTDESVGGHTDTDEFEEVGIDGNSSPPKASLPTPDVEARRLLAVEAVRSRYTAQPARPESDPYLDVPTHQGRTASHLFIDGDGNDDLELQEALLESIRQQTHSTSPIPPPVASGSGMPRYSPPPRPHVPVPNPRTAGGDESDDSMEYVDVPPEVSQPQPPARPQTQNQAQPPSPVAQPQLGSDDSDAFEEVDVSPPISRKPTPHHPANEIENGSPPPQPTLIDTVLLSDSDSEHDSPRRSSPPPPTHRAKSPRPPESTPPAPDVTARDFGEEEFTVRPRPTPAPASAPALVEMPPRVTHDAAALLDLRFADTSSKFDILSKPLSPPAAEAQPRLLSPLRETVPSVSRPSHSATSTSSLQAPLPIESAPPQHVSPLPPPSQEASSVIRPVSNGASSLFNPAPSVAPTPPQRRSPSPRQRSPSPTPWIQSPTLAPRQQSLPPEQVLEKAAEAVGTEMTRGDEEEEEEEEEMLPWSRSPTPQPRQQRQLDRGLPPSQDLIDAAIEEASKGDLRTEEAEYSEMAKRLRNEELESMREDATRDMARLLEQRNAEQRNADGITRQMASEIKEMLILFGIPFLDAPQEAEAECASLLTRSLVDGVVTDDSDVFLFGASRVYRHMFDGNKYLECYLSSDLERELHLDRDELIRLAYLLGGDYDDGLPGVGPVLARELLSEFGGEDGLEKFKVWWKKVQDGKDSEKDTNTTWKRKFKKGHKALVIEGNWPKPEIARAYYNPVVNESDEPFSWGGIDLDGLFLFLNRTMGWSSEYCMKDLKPLIDRLIAIKDGKATQQKSLPDFFDPSAGHDSFRRKKPVKYASERLQNVIKNWKTQQQASIEELEGEEGGEENDDVEIEEPATRPASKKRKSNTSTGAAKNGKGKGKAKSSTGLAAPPPRPAPKKRKNSTVASRKKRSQELRDARAAANGGVYSSEEDLDAIDDARPTPPPPPTTGRTRKQREQAPRQTKKRRTIEPVSDLEE